MSELNQVFLSILALAPPLLFAFFSAIGGRDFNWLGVKARIWKRLIAPLVFVSLLFAFKAHWAIAILYPTYLISCTVGYGAENKLEKVIRRSLWSLIRTMACLPLVLISGSYTLIILQAITGIACTVILGVKNPLSAPKEEFLINFISVAFVTYMLFS